MATAGEALNLFDSSILGDRVVVTLRRMIATGEIGQGERLVEREIAERLGTSRGPVREAIRTLQHEGLVETRPYAGACVTHLDRDEIDEVFLLRKQVELFAIAGASLRATEEDIARLRALTAEIAPAYAAGDAETLLNLDLAFHLGICEASHHSSLSATMRTLYPRLAMLFFPQMFSSPENYTPESFAESHVALVDAIAAGDVQASVERMEAHLDSFFVDVELRLDSDRARRRPAYLRKHRPARPTAVWKPLGTSNGA